MHNETSKSQTKLGLVWTRESEEGTLEKPWIPKRNQDQHPLCHNHCAEQRLRHSPCAEQRPCHGPCAEQRPCHGPCAEQRLCHSPCAEQHLRHSPCAEQRLCHSPCAEQRLCRSPCAEQRRRGGASAIKGISFGHPHHEPRDQVSPRGSPCAAATDNRNYSATHCLFLSALSAHRRNQLYSLDCNRCSRLA